jgi:hypothetical protein
VRQEGPKGCCGKSTWDSAVGNSSVHCPPQSRRSGLSTRRCNWQQQCPLPTAHRNQGDPDCRCDGAAMAGEPPPCTLATAEGFQPWGRGDELQTPLHPDKSLQILHNSQMREVNSQETGGYRQCMPPDSSI